MNPGQKEKFGYPYSGHLTGSPVSSKTCIQTSPEDEVISSQDLSCLTRELCPVVAILLVKKSLNQPAPIVFHFLLFCSTDDFEPHVHIAKDRITSPRCLPSIILVYPAFPPC